LLLPDPGVDPQTYFTDVLIKLVNLWAASRLDESHTVVLGHDRQTRGVTYRIALKILKKSTYQSQGVSTPLPWIDGGSMGMTT
jgi:hypothetical protein